MATVRKTITLTEQQDAWIAAQVAAGHYTNDSEAIRDLIRREQERGLEFEAIRQALIEGERSGAPEPFDFKAFKRRKSQQHGSGPAQPKGSAGFERPLRLYGRKLGAGSGALLHRPDRSRLRRPG